MPDVSVVVLTMGDRPRELGEALASCRRQAGVEAELIVVGNGVDPGARDVADVAIALPENVGIPAGRNAGARAATAALLCFLDDDARFEGSDVLAAVVARFAADDRLGVVGLQVIDEDGHTARRHDPRLRPRPGTPAAATSFPGGACVVRRAAFDEVGGLAGPFFYALEETDLAWRLLDAGWSVWFAADQRVVHPRTTPRRHTAYARRTARNRVWLAHRSLPLPLAVLYVAAWLAISLVRGARQRGEPAAIVSGTWAGLREPLGPRRPLSWATCRRMAAIGRPPII